jgi:GNAT superfamily N-acetyltransferase
MSTEVDSKSAGAPTEEHPFGAPPAVLPAFEPAPPTRVDDRSGVTIETIDLSVGRDRRRFMRVPDPIYAGDPNYIAPLRLDQNKFLDPAKNKAFRYLTVRAFIAVKDGRDVGRMTAQVDGNYEKHNGRRVGFFGFFESIDDAQIAHALLNEGLRWLKAEGCVEVFGPANFTLSHQGGCIVDNFDRPPMLEEGYNHPYYERLLTSFGLGKAKDLLIWWIDLADGLDTPKRQRVAKIADRIRKREGVTLRTGRIGEIREEIGRIFDIYVSAWEKNWGFAPPDREEFLDLAEPMKQIVIPDLCLFVEVEGKPVAFSLTLPNVNEKLPKDGRIFPFGWTKLFGLKKVKTGRLWTLGTIPEYRKRGLESMMFVETVRNCRKNGIMGGEIGWTLEDNHLINRAIESMEGRRDRTYRIFGMKL